MTDYLKIIADTEAKHGLKPGVLKKLIEVESGGNVGARSPRGAIGLTQLMPETAKELGVDPHDPIQNIEGGALYLRKGLDKFGGDYAQAIAGYNAGHNNKAVVSRDFERLPDETKKYTNKFLDFIISSASADETPYKATQASNEIKWDDAPEPAKPETQGAIQWDADEPKQSPDPKGLHFLEAVGKGVFNAPSDAVSYVGNAAKAIAHPIDTVQGVLDVGQGTLRNILPDFVPMPGNAKENALKASAVGQDLKSRYGDWDKVKQSIAEHPIQTLGDVSALAGGVGALAKAGGATRLADMATTAAKTTDPLRMMGNAAIGAGKTLASPLGVNSGVGTEAIKAAASTGFKGGTAAAAFKENMTGNVPIEDVVNTAKTGLSNMYKERGMAYRAALADGVINDPTTLNFSPIRKAVDDMHDVGTYHDININPSAAGVQSSIDNMVTQFENEPLIHNVEGFDALKKAIGNIRDSTQPHTPERFVSDKVYHTISNAINDQAPGYAKVMKDYSEASTLTKELERALSLGEKPAVDTTIRKLQSLMRNNVQTTYGYRTKLGDMLEQNGATDLRAKIAGQALSSWEPRGLARLGAQGGGTGAIASLLTGHPLAAAGLTAQVLSSSPRLVGSVSHRLGEVAGKTSRGYKKLPAGSLNAVIAVDRKPKQKTLNQMR